MKRLGPELKMPDLKALKAPAFLADVYYDLRERRLLPLLALVVVAIAAVPFLLGGDAEQPALPPAAEDATAELGEEIADASALTVVEAKPGLRDYRKRLRGRKPTDPFRQHYTAPMVDGAKLNPQTETASTGSSSTSATTTVGDSGGGDSGGGEPTGGEAPSGGGAPAGGKKKQQPKLTLFTFAIDARIVRRGSKDAAKKSDGKPIVKRRVLPQTALPGKKAAVVTYMGPSRKKGKALLLVSNKVESVFGDARCVSGEGVCQLLEVEPGFPVTFVYGANEVRYTVNVLKIEPVPLGRG